MHEKNRVKEAPLRLTDSPTSDSNRCARWTLETRTEPRWRGAVGPWVRAFRTFRQNEPAEHGGDHKKGKKMMRWTNRTNLSLTSISCGEKNRAW